MNTSKRPTRKLRRWFRITLEVIIMVCFSLLVGVVDFDWNFGCIAALIGLTLIPLISIYILNKYGD